MAVRRLGSIDSLGYISCTACDERFGQTMFYAEVYEDSAPHNAEACDSCGLSLVTSADVRGEWS